MPLSYQQYNDVGLHVTLTETTLYQTRDVRNLAKPATPPSTIAPTTQNKKESNSQLKAEALYRDKEYVAEGMARVIADPMIVANATITLEGVGNVMSGNWYVESVRHTWSRQGYDMELELRSNVAGGLKPATPQTTASPARKETVTPKVSKTTYTIKKGDTLWSIALNYYKNGTLWTKLWEANKATLIARDNRNLKSPGHWIHPGTTIVIP